MSDRYQLWGGCFQEEPSEVLRRLNDSLAVDVRLYQQDIRGSQAWALELHQCGYLSDEDYKAINEGLKIVDTEISEELFKYGRLRDEEEDIHSVVERRLQKQVGDAALRLHTARSRNDQSATNTKLWMTDNLGNLYGEIKKFVSILVSRAEKEMNIIIPGYTHLQRAQPIRWSHFLLSYAWTLRDDFMRLKEQWKRLSRCPLGSGALAGCALPIDRNRLANSLGFTDVTPNSLFAVGSRDHILEFLNWSTITSIHLSRFAEDLILYGSQEFGFVKFSDQFSTGSSLMPQKRNPDGLELVRCAAGHLLGDAFAFASIMKGLPSTYNKDLQSDKEILFRSYDKLLDCLKVASGTIRTMKIVEAKAQSSLESTMLATDLAHALVRQGVPFRRAHHIVGSILQRAAELSVDLKDLRHEEYIAICPEFGSKEIIAQLFSWEASVEQYTSIGGTSKTAVNQQIADLKDWLNILEHFPTQS